jgi:hypothetical protein
MTLTRASVALLALLGLFVLAHAGVGFDVIQAVSPYVLVHISH